MTAILRQYLILNYLLLQRQHYQDRMKSSNLKSNSNPFKFYHDFFIPFISSANLKFTFYPVNSPESRTLVNKPTKKAFEKFKSMGVFSRFYGNFAMSRKSFCSFKNVCSISSNSCSQAHVKQVRSSPSNKYPIADSRKELVMGCCFCKFSAY